MQELWYEAPLISPVVKVVSLNAVRIVARFGLSCRSASWLKKNKRKKQNKTEQKYYKKEEKKKKRQTDRQTDRQTQRETERERGEREKETERPVSYTHLTLPTRSTV